MENLPEKPLRVRWQLFCDNLITGMTATEAYCLAYKQDFTNKRTYRAARVQSTNLLKRPEIQKELNRLRAIQQGKNEALRLNIEDLHNDAVNTVKNIMLNGKSEGTKLEASKEVLDRSAPKKSINISAKMQFNVKDLKRMKEVLTGNVITSNSKVVELQGDSKIVEKQSIIEVIPESSVSSIVSGENSKEVIPELDKELEQ